MNRKAIILSISIFVVGMLAIPTIFVFASSMDYARGGYYGFGMMGSGMMGGAVGSSIQQPTQSGTSQKQHTNKNTHTPKHTSYQVVKVVANDWNWALNKDHLKYGKPVKFIISSSQGIHGFSIMETNISVPVSAGSQPQDIVWKPNAKGTYTIACNVYCGVGHSSMLSTFTVS